MARITKCRSLFILLSLFIPCIAASAGEMDPSAAWPLCGRISENPPPNWQETDGCPADRFGNPNFTDARLAYTFGPRLLASGGDRYDFHRGLDIPTPLGTPIFAAADGVVQTAGIHPSYEDPVIRIRHYRPGKTTCSGGGGCYNTLYMHVSNWIVSEGQTVQKGQLIGHTGAASSSGWEHLHFEVRDAPANDPSSSWSRDAVSVFHLLPYDEPNNSLVTFGSVDIADPQAVQAELTLTSNRYDFVRLELTVLDDNLQPVSQPGDTPDSRGYYVLPAFYDLDVTNFQYSHKDSANFPWSSFQQSGTNECPYFSDHGASYDAAVHLDKQNPNNFQEGLFNGVLIRTSKYWHNDEYYLNLTFLQLKGPARCIQARALFVSGDQTTSEWGACVPGNTPPAAPTNLTAQVFTSGSKKKPQKTVLLSWQDNANNELSYVIERCQETGKGRNKTCNFSTLIDSLPPDTSTYTDQPGSGTFQYRVKARNATGDSGYSNEVKI